MSQHRAARQKSRKPSVVRGYLQFVFIISVLTAVALAHV